MSKEDEVFERNPVVQGTTCSSEFCDLLTTVDPCYMYIISCRAALSKEIIKVVIDMKVKIGSCLKEARKVSICVDVWSKNLGYVYTLPGNYFFSLWDHHHHRITLHSPLIGEWFIRFWLSGRFPPSTWLQIMKAIVLLLFMIVAMSLKMRRTNLTVMARTLLILMDIVEFGDWSWGYVQPIFKRLFLTYFPWLAVSDSFIWLI